MQAVGCQIGAMPARKPRPDDLLRAITAHREARGWTLEEVARRLNNAGGIDTHTKGTVGRWERGERGISPTNKRLLASVYGIDVAALHEPPKPHDINRMLQGQPDEVWRQAADIVRVILSRGSGE